MYNLWHKWKYRHSKLYWNVDNNDVAKDIMKNYHEYPSYDPRHGWEWCIEGRYKGSFVYGYGRTIEDAYEDIKEHERIHDKILKELENERKHS